MSALQLQTEPNDRLWPYLGMVEGELLDLQADQAAPAVARLVHDAFVGHVSSPAFACVGGKAAVSRGTYRVAMLGELAAEDSTEALARGLRNFATERDDADPDFFTYAAFFTGPVGRDDAEFERLLWRQLQRLNEVDSAPWDARVSADPEDPRFSFSFGARAYFIVGLHGASSRWSRRFAWPTLVFNPHEQFDELREDGRMRRWQEVIRGRDAELQGGINPNLGDFGELPEARQYSGQQNPKDWKCPFHAHQR
ncbi:MAG TPA: guanitoxin biosynthesis heme-dependent pre-guanitoxin N-hydroxylase GntA [Candidatus Dormibacteraeota bacterium]|nr:guanitoxin biosynthesis heme-dependent pre-guanitoxin N-hydroxylase GntA [Candidatus Dormibacteraeota bacterium]